MSNGDEYRIDWVERKTAELLRKAKRTGFFDSVIDDARWFQGEHGYAWDVALVKSLEYWAS